MKFPKIKIRKYEYDYVYGSRKVVKDPGNEDSGFYEKDLWTIVGSRLEGLLPKGYIVYGEIVGWVPDTATPIQTGYTYRIPEGTARLFVYRVAVLNEDGYPVDLSWTAVKEFCESIGVDTVPELDATYGWHLTNADRVEDYLDTRFADIYPNALPTDGSMIDEGVCLRVEGTTPTIVKAKSPIFLQHETKLLDKGTSDIETEEVPV